MTSWPQVLRGALICTLMATVSGAAACACVALTGVADDARAWFAFESANSPRQVAGATDIALDNLRLAVAPIVAALVLPHAPRLRALLDIVLALLLVGNATLVGVAVAAHGWSLAQSLMPHVPLELAGFSTSGGIYTAARKRPVRFASAATATAIALALLVAGAAVEAPTPPASRR